MTTLAARSNSTRSALVSEIRARLDRESFPRFIVLFMLLVAGGGAFLCSVLTLRAGVESMALRYALATAGGYLAFLLLIRLWIAVRRGWCASDALDWTPDVDLRVGSGRASSGGSSDGIASRFLDGFDWSFDLDGLWWLVFVLFAAGAGLLAIAFVVYSAPLLLAEVALDAALVGTVYRRLRREDAGHWAMTALRCTWASAGVLVAFMAVLGFGLQRLAPDAFSIGEVISQLLAG